MDTVDIAIAHYLARVVVFITTGAQLGLQLGGASITAIGVGPGSFEFAAVRSLPGLFVCLTNRCYQHCFSECFSLSPCHGTGTVDLR